MKAPVTESHDGQHRQAPPRPRILYSGLARLVSLLVAGALSLLLTLYPQAVVAGGQTPGHGTLMLCMWGIAAGFVHGVGFVPYNGRLRVALGPLAAWILMLVGTLLLARG